MISVDSTHYAGGERAFMKKLVSGMIIALLLAGMLTLAFKVQSVKAANIIVPDDYPTMQGALDAAGIGTTIYVRSGVYNENVTIYPIPSRYNISIVGENTLGTVLNGSFNTYLGAINSTVEYLTINGIVQLGNSMGPPRIFAFPTAMYIQASL